MLFLVPSGVCAVWPDGPANMVPEVGPDLTFPFPC